MGNSYARGATPITECPACGAPMAKGKRASVTVNWEGAKVVKRKYSFDARQWTERVVDGTKGKTRIVCRECAEKAASMVGIGRPEEVRA